MRLRPVYNEILWFNPFKSIVIIFICWWYGQVPMLNDISKNVEFSKVHFPLSGNDGCFNVLNLGIDEK